MPVLEMQRSGAWVVLGFGMFGCNLFDEHLAERLERAHFPVGDVDAGDAGADAGALDTLLSDVCRPRELSQVTGSIDPLELSVEALSADVAEAGECPISRPVLDGAEGFFEISAEAGERWHFHLDAAPGQNLAVFVSRSCDLRECIASADVCGINEPEHFTFVPQTSGTFVVGIEGIAASADPALSLLAIHPLCGDRAKDHGEVCDDGNTVPGDGCDATCRVELLGRQAEEVEPNDDSYLANVLEPIEAGHPFNIRGKIAGASCQPDYYLLEVGTTGLLTGRLLDGLGQECEGAPPIEMTIWGADEDTLRQTVKYAAVAAQDGSCPSLPDHLLSAGVYFLRIQHTQQAEQFDYQLEIELTDTVFAGE